MYVQNKYIGEWGRLISNILDISDKLNIDGYFVIVDIKKVFESLYHGLLLVIFKKFAFDNNFIERVKKILTNQESCIINNVGTTLYFKLENDACQGDPISAYLFIIALEIILQG